MNKGSIVERLCSDLIAKSRDINGLLYFTFTTVQVSGPPGDVTLVTSPGVKYYLYKW